MPRLIGCLERMEAHRDPDGGRSADANVAASLVERHAPPPHRPPLPEGTPAAAWHAGEEAASRA